MKNKADKNNDNNSISAAYAWSTLLMPLNYLSFAGAVAACESTIDARAVVDKHEGSGREISICNVI